MSDKENAPWAPGGRRKLLWAAGGALLAGVGAGVWWGSRQESVAVDAGPSPELAAFWAASWQDAQGQPVAVERFQGKPLLLNFWATWCPPCVEEFPMLDAFYRENRAKGWQVLGLAIDRTDMVQRFLRQNPVDFTVVMAGLGGTELMRALGNPSGGLPFTVAVNSAGAIAQRKLGRVSADNLQQWAGLK